MEQKRMAVTGLALSEREAISNEAKARHPRDLRARIDFVRAAVYRMVNRPMQRHPSLASEDGDIWACERMDQQRAVEEDIRALAGIARAENVA
jgi:hypothetical protein